MKKNLLAGVVLGVLAIMLFAIPDALAQGCSLCTKTAAQLGPKGATGLNNGIIYLGVVPLSILGTLGFLWWRHYKNN